MRTPADKQITFTLYSHPMKDLKMRWKALLVFAPGSADDTEAALTVCDGEGTPIPVGELDFAGTRIAVKDGKGGMRCGDFARGKHETAIWLYRKGKAPVPGALTFE